MGAARHVVLVGLMAVGKTSVGTRLAARLGRPYFDNDVLLRARLGLDARQAAAAMGLDRLHAEEAQALLDALDGEEPSVISAAASVVASPAVRARLRQHTVVWLHDDVETLARKVAEKPHRPYADRDALEVLRAQLAEREPWYREVATFVVRRRGRRAREVADEVARRVAGGG